MTHHEFAFVLDAPTDDETLEDRLFEAGCDDATLILQKGALFLSFDRLSDNYIDAVVSAYDNICEAGVSITSFDPDYLVSATEIAHRAQLSRAVISKYAAEERENGFPPPTRLVASRRPLFDWVEVSLWLVTHEKLDRGFYCKAVVSRAMNFGVQAKKMGFVVDVPAHVRRELGAA